MALKTFKVAKKLYKAGGLYVRRMGQFQRNARRYLVSVALTGAAMGIYNLLFNFFVLSLGYDEAFLGKLVSLNQMSIVVTAIFSNFLLSRLNRKWVLFGGILVTALSVAVMVLFPLLWVIVLMSAVFGGAQCLITISIAPFLMESSGEEERTYLFSAAFALQMAATFAGNWAGGRLPSWLLRNGWTLDAEAGYRTALLVMVLLTLIGLLPILRIRTLPIKQKLGNGGNILPVILHHWRHFGKLMTPVLLTSLGAGLIMPFMNVFFRHMHHQSDQNIGLVFAGGSLAMGLGMLLAPPLAEKFGKVQLFALSRGFSLPFLVILAISPWFVLSALAYNVRIMLMNMAGPVYQNFVMEDVEQDLRPAASSMLTVFGSLGWGLSSMLSGWIQVRYGFGPAFVGAGIGYALGVFSSWWFFLRPQKLTASKQPQAVSS